MEKMIEENIPVSKREAVMAAIRSAIPLPVTEISQLTGGLSQATVFRVSASAQSFLLKVSAENEAANATGPMFHAYAAKAGVAPAVYYQDNNNGIMITEYIAARPVDQVLSADEKIRSLAGNIRRQHQSVIPPEQGPGELLSVVDEMLNWFITQNFLSDDTKALLQASFALIREAYPWNDIKRVLSHNDLNPRNVLCDGERLWFIDWDAASVNDPYVDLAIAANFFTYTPETERLLLSTYFAASASPYQYARFRVMRQVCQLIYAKMIMSLALQSAPADYEFGDEFNNIGLMEIRTQLRSGELSMDNYSGQLLYGRAMFNDALQQISSYAFRLIIGQLTMYR